MFHGGEMIDFLVKHCHIDLEGLDKGFTAFYRLYSSCLND